MSMKRARYAPAHVTHLPTFISSRLHCLQTMEKTGLMLDSNAVVFPASFVADWA